jgi:predicted HD superfamily hydrolase involved in NAD metabolism
MHLMQELAELYDLNQDSAVTAGLLHDVAKDLSQEDQLTLAKRAGITFAYPCEQIPMYLHGPVGAYLVQTKLGVTDSMIVNAIRVHTSHGEVEEGQMRFAWCLRLADILAPVIPWTGMKKLRRKVYNGQLEEAKLLLSAWVIEYFQASGIPVHPNFRRNVATLSARLHVEPSFYEREG